MTQNFYIHIPFCRQKCPYCKFALTPVFDEVKKRRYLAHLKREIRDYFRDEKSSDIDEGGLFNADNNLAFSNTRNDRSPKTIYFGGGTPSVLGLDEVREIISLFPGQSTHLPANIEISFECNPEDITSDFVGGLFDLGIDRISLGVQSLDDDTLRAIHRSDRESIFRALECMSSAIAKKDYDAIQTPEIQKNGSPHYATPRSRRQIPSINIDFILGLPYTKKGYTLESIKALHKKYPCISHTSVYMLEDGLYPKEWRGHGITELEMEREYSEICEYFESIGWHHYEISSWSRPGYECVHNRGYWDHTNYRGFGLSATSYEDRKRWENSHSFSGYYRGERDSIEILNSGEIQIEKVIHDLRTFRLGRGDFDAGVVEALERKGWTVEKDGKIILTPAGIFRENFILSELIGE